MWNFAKKQKNKKKNEDERSQVKMVKILFFLNVKFRQKINKNKNKNEDERSQVKMGGLVKIRS
jgi:hypothetical protein